MPATQLHSDSSQTHMLVLCVLWFILVIPGLTFGLPQVLDPDEQIFVYGALEILQHPKFDPGWYGAPGSTLMDAMAVVYGSYFLIAQLFGSIDSMAAHIEQYYHVFVLFGRIVTALAVLLTSIILYRVLRQSFTELACLVGAASLLLAPEVVNISQVTRMDIFVALFLLAVALHCGRIIDKPEMKSFAFAGAALGAAVVSKYPGVIGALMIPLAALIAYNRDLMTLGAAFKGVVVAAGASILMAAVLAPYLFINFSAMLADVAAEARNVNVGNTGSGFFENLGFYLAVAIPQTMGPALAIFGTIGLIYGMFSENRARVGLLVAFGITFLVFIAALQLQWVRWALPLAPVLCVGVAALVDRGLKTIDVGSYRQAFPITAVLILVLGPSAVTTARSTALKALNRDTRVIAAEWIKGNIAGNSVIAVETHTPQLPMDHYRLLIPGRSGLVAAEEVWELKKRPPGFYGSFGHMPVAVADVRSQFVTRAEYVVTNGWEERYFKECERYARQCRIYEFIREDFDEVRVFHPDGDVLGGKIAIFKNRRELPD